MSLINKVIFTPDESETLGNFILEHEDYIKTLGVSDYELTSKNSLTGTFRFYNWFYSDIGPILRDKIFKYFKTLGIPKPLYIQCWANTFRKGEGIGLHKHALKDDDYLCANIFLKGNVDIGTTYIINQEAKKIPNKIGEMTLFSSLTPHYVEKNHEDNIRVSMGLDIHSSPDTVYDLHNKKRYYYWE
jgi:hypothetical protein